MVTADRRAIQMEANHTMIEHRSRVARLVLASTGLAAVATVFASDGKAHAQSRKQREDARTCESFGARFGTPAYSNCMLEQQRRRDLKQRETLEEMAITSQIAKDGQIMAERARRQPCDRNHDRRDCRG